MCIDNLNSQPLPTPDPAEAMRAKCEAIARKIDGYPGVYRHGRDGRLAAMEIADAIAALKTEP